MTPFGRYLLFCASLIVAAILPGFTYHTVAQNPAESQNKSRPRRAEDAPQTAPTPPKKEDETTLSSDDVLKVETNLTNVLFTASDKQKRFISTLRREDVRVLEDGVPQQIFTFQPNSDLPLSLAILIDCSGSEERTLPEEKGAARTFRSEEHTSELQSPCNLVCRLLLEKKKNKIKTNYSSDTLTSPK